MTDTAAPLRPAVDGGHADDRLEVFCLPPGTLSADTAEWLVTGLVAVLVPQMPAGIELRLDRDEAGGRKEDSPKTDTE